MGRQHRFPCLLVFASVCLAVWSAVASLGDTADTSTLTTLPEDPLQPVWNSLDAIPSQVLGGVRGQIETLSRSTEASLSQLRSLLTSLEDLVKQNTEALLEDVGDLVTDRLVNAQAMILEDINKLSAAVTSAAHNCSLQSLADSKATENQESSELTRCSDPAAAAAARMEAASARVEETGSRVDKAAARVNETALKVEEVATRMEEISERMEEMAKRMDEGAARVEEAAARVEEAAVRVEEVAVRVEEMAAKVEEATGRVEEAAERVEEAANRTQQPVLTTAAGDNGAMNTSSLQLLPRDCADIHWNQPEAPSGVYRTYPTLDHQTPVVAYCDMGVSGAKETGGWTVVLRRHNTSWGLENFNRSWAEYRTGFGRPGKGEWWYGLASLHAVTYRQPYEAVFLLHDLQRGTFNATYNTFRVESEGRAFRLAVGGFSGNLSHDALAAKHHGRPFSTYDRDNDGFTTGSCAANNGGGWWYDRCHRAALTATFPNSPDRAARTIRWYTAEDWLVLDDVTLKIRPTNYRLRFTEFTDGE